LAIHIYVVPKKLNVSSLINVILILITHCNQQNILNCC